MRGRRARAVCGLCAVEESARREEGGEEGMVDERLLLSRGRGRRVSWSHDPSCGHKPATHDAVSVEGEAGEREE